MSISLLDVVVSDSVELSPDRTRSYTLTIKYQQLAYTAEQGEHIRLSIRSSMRASCSRAWASCAAILSAAKRRSASTLVWLPKEWFPRRLLLLGGFGEDSELFCPAPWPVLLLFAPPDCACKDCLGIVQLKDGQFRRMGTKPWGWWMPRSIVSVKYKHSSYLPFTFFSGRSHGAVSSLVSICTFL